ncbi:hypothetical protein [Tissierella creatinophila]|uniref:Uncharacterized protein n=1 Tax=Tissierella creatinophila DSM 6911 TaxID=1123403 RepID=A0A1U7M548_TISCR|nr:hypothetical protein [Tissierella creatinophila]OLS02442.1 hypothetical protein TICRE_15940 [Tissierella creatinophila DSM 6911]
MICKICKVDKDLKNFHNLENGIDDCCSQCRAKEKIAKRKRGEILITNEGCFADLGNECDILKDKDCYKCNFYKTKEQYEEGLKKYPLIEENKGNKVDCILRNKITDEELVFSSMVKLSLFLGKAKGWACQVSRLKGNKFDYKNFQIEIRR